MIEIHPCEQGTEEWALLRSGLVTASELKCVLAKSTEMRLRRGYMLRLAGEQITGLPAETYTNAHMQRGREMEAEARNLYAFANDADPNLVGFIHNHDIVAGCSPDSLIGIDGMLEIKTMLPAILIDTLLRDRMPPEHKAQVQGGLWIADKEWIDFMGYWPGVPSYIARQYRDEPYIKELAAEVARFNEELAAIVEQIRHYGNRWEYLRATLTRAVAL